MNTISTVHDNACGSVVQPHSGATAARVSNGEGHHVDVRWDAQVEAFVIEADSSNIRVETGSNKVWVAPR